MTTPSQFDERLHDIIWSGSQWSKIPEMLNKDEQEAAIKSLVEEVTKIDPALREQRTEQLKQAPTGGRE